MDQTPFQEAFDYIEQKAGGFKAKLGISTGSNLEALVELVKDPISISYSDIPGVEAGQVDGHKHARLVLGTLEGIPVVFLQGRLHRYEGLPYHSMQILFNALKVLGCEAVLIANASGSLRQEVGPGEMVVIHDHINMSFESPLRGANDDKIGPRFVSMTNTYDKTMRAGLHEAAAGLQFSMTEGIYVGVAGPMFETPAEIRAYRAMGAEVVGMSTIPDVIFSRHCGLKVAVVAAITNFASGMTDQELSHDETIAQCQRVADRMNALFKAFILSYPR